MKSESSGVIHVLYDQDCPLCIFQMKMLTWLDWNKQLTLLPLNHPEVKNKAPELTREELLEAIHCITQEKRVFKGARCLRHIGMKLPLMFPMGIFLYTPGVIWIAERIYMLISKNRHLLSKLFGCKDACSILPSNKKGRSDSGNI